MEHELRLFIVGSSERSNEAIRNFWAITNGPLASCAQATIVDVSANPEAAETYNVFVTPTLIRLGPGPSKRVFGDLSDHAQVLNALGITRD